MKQAFFIYLSLLIFLCFNCSCVQKTQSKSETEQPNFAGTWQLDISRSNLNELDKEVLETNSRNYKNYSQIMIIEQNFPTVKIIPTEKFDGSEKQNEYLLEHPELTEDFIYYADGRGENEPIDTSVSLTQNVAKIVDKKLIITKYNSEGSDKKSADSVGELSLSNDGKTLIVESRIISDKSPKNSAKEEENDRMFNSYRVYNRLK